MTTTLLGVVSALVLGLAGIALLLGSKRVRRLGMSLGERVITHSDKTEQSSAGTQNPQARAERWLNEAGLAGARLRDFALACSTLCLGAFLGTLALFGGVLPALLTALGVSGTPVALYRKRRHKRLQEAQEAWPRIIEEIRLLVTNSGKSIPAALFTAGARAPASLRFGFEAAEREWQLTTDFERAISVLKNALAHPTGDTIAETLLGAYAVGGVDLESRLRDLSNDRVADLTARKDARSKQAGARFARVFVLAVPVGMALMGLGIGRGRASYQTTTGQILVAIGVLVVISCWYWASSIMALPTERRVFSQ